MNHDPAHTCEICHQPLPTTGVGQRRKICLRTDCARERKRRTQQQWRAENPEYFKGRYDDLKNWLAAHPGYLKRWRQQRRASAPSPQAPLAVHDIQVEISPCSHTARSRGHDIQVQITCKIHNAARVLHVASRDIQISQPALATSTSRALGCDDIQV